MGLRRPWLGLAYLSLGRGIPIFARGGIGMPVQGWFVDEESGAIGADRFLILAHINEDVRVIKRWQSANAHKLFGADFNLRQTSLIVKMGGRMCGCHEKSSHRISHGTIELSMGFVITSPAQISCF
jgi:hypothetical protein